MQRSRFLAGLIGPVLIAVSVSLLINGDVLPEIVALVNRGYLLIMMVGIVAMVGGLAIVQTHNVWRGWPVIITIFGWLFVVGGAARIMFPKQIAALAPTIVASNLWLTVLAVGFLLLGSFLTFQALRTESSAP